MADRVEKRVTLVPIRFRNQIIGTSKYGNHSETNDGFEQYWLQGFSNPICEHANEYRFVTGILDGRQKYQNADQRRQCKLQK